VNLNVTLLGQAITFAVFVWFTMRFVWPPIMTAMQTRQKKIADGLQAAEQGEIALVEAQKEVASLLAEARTKANELVEHAQRRATQVIEEAKVQAQEEGKRLITAARTDIDKQANQVREQLRSEVVSIAMLGAQKVLERSIDEKAHHDLLQKLATQI